MYRGARRSCTAVPEEEKLLQLQQQKFNENNITPDSVPRCQKKKNCCSSSYKNSTKTTSTTRQRTFRSVAYGMESSITTLKLLGNFFYPPVSVPIRTSLSERPDKNGLWIDVSVDLPEDVPRSRRCCCDFSFCSWSSRSFIQCWRWAGIFETETKYPKT